MKPLPRITFPKEWGFEPPRNAEEWCCEEISAEAVRAFGGIIRSVADADGSIKEILEDFGRAFSASTGDDYFGSSDVGWASKDLTGRMMDARSNPPKFIRTFVEALNAARTERTDGEIPEISHLNQVLESNRIGYVIGGDGQLQLRLAYVAEGDNDVPHLVKARAELAEAWDNATKLLAQGKPREAVEAIWWVIESITADFSGGIVAGVQVKGEYFNAAIKDVKRGHTGTIRHRALSLLEQIQSWLSEPKGPGVRHGANSLAERIDPAEARLIIGLVREYAKYLTHLAEESAPPEGAKP